MHFHRDFVEHGQVTLFRRGVMLPLTEKRLSVS